MSKNETKFIQYTADDYHRYHNYLKVKNKYKSSISFCIRSRSNSPYLHSHSSSCTTNSIAYEPNTKTSYESFFKELEESSDHDLSEFLSISFLTKESNDRYSSDNYNSTSDSLLIVNDIDSGCFDNSHLEDHNLENRVQQIEAELLFIKYDFQNRVQKLESEILSIKNSLKKF
ncbi:1279_t:CDS:1 [Gigaspora margarita]|uniref:1279_t:CDS:1 n=1 Tax=Gigaspora margarita TaxID=4874 RepID=A0ABM8W741_GIGMA|nr:1279_t:CDS:1 [Gigaspora margarita]